MFLAFWALEIYRAIVFGAVIASWFFPGSRHPLILLLERATEPVLTPIRRVLPPMGGLDLSPLALLIGLSLLQRIL